MAAGADGKRFDGVLPVNASGDPERPPGAVRYVREHVRVAIQPLDAPDENPRHLLDVYEQLGSEEMLLYASGYPHWDSDDPDFALPTILSDDVLQAIQHDNAKRLYNL